MANNTKQSRFGLIGRGIGYSMSKTLHEDLFRRMNITATYDIIDIENLTDNIEYLRVNYDGFNVTKPYKVDIMSYLDEVDETARRIGSVNTVTNVDGVLKGYNTDLDGILATFERDGIDAKGKRCLIVGYGGVSKTLIYAVNLMGASVINIAGRNKDKIEALIAEMSNIGIEVGIDQNVCEKYDIVINATTLGTSADHPTPIDVRLIQGIEYYFDLVYNPRCTKMMEKCAKCGAKVRDGLYMLLMQAVKAEEFYLDLTYSDEDIFEVYLHLAGEIFKKQHKTSENTSISLVGFMGSGKSTVGRRLGEVLGMSLIDTDDIITERYGAIKDIFDKHGEAYFREIETNILRDVCDMENVIISTGGGIVMSDANREILRSDNTLVIYLDASFSKVASRVAGSDRPLFRDETRAHELYDMRDPLYRDVADIVVGGDKTIDDTVLDIFTR